MCQSLETCCCSCCWRSCERGGRSPDQRPGGDPGRPPLQRVWEDRMQVTGVGCHHKKLSVVVAQGLRKSAMLLSLPGQRAMRTTLREDGGERSGGKPLLPPVYTVAKGHSVHFSELILLSSLVLMNQFKESIQCFFEAIHMKISQILFLFFIYCNLVCLSLVCCSHD